MISWYLIYYFRDMNNLYKYVWFIDKGLSRVRFMFHRSTIPLVTKEKNRLRILSVKFWINLLIGSINYSFFDSVSIQLNPILVNKICYYYNWIEFNFMNSTDNKNHYISAEITRICIYCIGNQSTRELHMSEISFFYIIFYVLWNCINNFVFPIWIWKYDLTMQYVAIFSDAIIQVRNWIIFQLFKWKKYEFCISFQWAILYGVYKHTGKVRAIACDDYTE